MRLRLEILGVLLAGVPVVLSSGRGSAERAQAPTAGTGYAVATFAGGCFWSMEHPFDELRGVVSVTVGYTGGHTKNPTYDEVSAGGTGHAEAVQVTYDARRLGYERLLDVFWHNIDPLTLDGQICDFGSQYRTAIYFHDATQRRLAEESKRRLETSARFRRPIVTQLVAAGEFYRAEEYHQHYYRKNPTRYAWYRQGCGRDRRLKELWGSSAAPAAGAAP